MTILKKYSLRIKRKFPDHLFSWEIFTELIFKNLANRPYWLDIGAGFNILIKEQPGADFAVGIDKEKPAEVYTNSKSAYCVASVYNLPLNDRTFDFITSRYTFEHLEFPKKAMAEISRVMKPEGIFVMQTSNLYNPIVFLANLIPFPLKKVIIRKLFKDNPSGTFKTYYRINTPSSIKPEYGQTGNSWRLVLQRLIMVEDILCQSRLLFTISFQLYKLIRLFGAKGFSSNMIAVFKKTSKLRR